MQQQGGGDPGPALPDNVLIEASAVLDAVWELAPTMPVWQHPVFAGKQFRAPLPVAGNYGAPTTPLLRGIPGWLRSGVVRPLARQTRVRFAYRALTHPAVAIFLLGGAGGKLRGGRVLDYLDSPNRRMCCTRAC